MFKNFDVNNKYILIIDYNLVRVNDVKYLSEYAKIKYGLSTILIRHNPSDIDYNIAEIVLDLDPRHIDFVDIALSKLSKFVSNIKAGLVFSDNAVFSGAQLLESMSMLVDNSQLARAAFSKISYRESEQKYKELFTAQGIFVPDFTIIKTISDLKNFINDHPHGSVIKPSCEGNNRGVVLINNNSEAGDALNEVSSYIEDGLMCEEKIIFPYEYSFDGVGHLYFITEKISDHGRYPVEKGQIIPSYLSPAEENLLIRTGRLVNYIVGQNIGPFHNEIKISDDKMHSAVIEPNRRPAGMKIWSLAEKVYGLNFYKLWIDSLLNGILPLTLPSSKGVAAIQMLNSPLDGILCVPQELYDNPDKLWREFLPLLCQKFELNTYDLELFDFKWNVSNNIYVDKVPRDNSQFIAQLCFFIKTSGFDIRPLLNDFNLLWQQSIKRFIRV